MRVEQMRPLSSHQISGTLKCLFIYLRGGNEISRGEIHECIKIF